MGASGAAWRVLTLPAAAALLGAADSPASLAAIAAAAGFPPPALPLDAELRRGLGLDAIAESAHIIAGEGTLRALLVVTRAGAPLRETVATISQRVARRAPHLLWLLVAAAPDERAAAIATWSVPAPGRTRVAALMVDRANVHPSDAETVRSLAGVSEAADVLTHGSWFDVLGRSALTRRFYRALESTVSTLAVDARGRATEADRRELALLLLSRLLFLVFLEAKGWLDGDPRFLERRFTACMERGGRFDRRVLLPLFFGTLNTRHRHRAEAARALGRIPFLNGGLFARTPLERRVALTFTDESLGIALGELLTRYRFTAREDSPSWSEAAIDPEMLGKALESLMGATLRRDSGSYYTPQPVVEQVTFAALRDALAGPGVDAAHIDLALRGEPTPSGAVAAMRARLRAIRILDPACGSGAFLVHALETMASVAGRLGDDRTLTIRRRELLTHCIHGVDVNPAAVRLCELRLWLSVVIEDDERDPLAVSALPNLDRNIRAGDALAGSAFRGEVLVVRGPAALARLRDRYARATGARKRTLQHALDRTERTLAIGQLDARIARVTAARRDLVVAMRGRDLFGERLFPTVADRTNLAGSRATLRELTTSRRTLAAGGALPFAWGSHFPHVAAHGGFDLVLGNPPWVRLHRIPASARAMLRARFEVFRGAAWERGAAAARAAPGFAAQVDLAALFVERSLDLLRPGGTLALLLPAKLWRSLAGGGARRLIAERTTPSAIADLTESPHSFDAAVYPSLLVARVKGGEQEPPPVAAAAVHRRRDVIAWPIVPSRLRLDDDPASPWLLLPPPVREAFDRVTRAGVPLSESAFGSPQLGVKCGCNEAFVVQLAGGANGLATVRSGEHCGAVERELLRPLLRGEQVTPWTADGPAEFLLWTHGSDGAPLARLPLHAAHWLGRWRHVLARRADARGGAPWWTLFRTASARYERSRVVWADIGRRPRALVLAPGDDTVALNSCYVLPCNRPDDALALAALLNSPLAAAWLGVIAEPARGGFRRYLAWTVSLLPVPHDWPRARTLLASLADRAIEHDDVTAEELLDAAMRSYRIRRSDLAPLLAWNAR